MQVVRLHNVFANQSMLLQNYFLNCSSIMTQHNKQKF